MSENHFKHVFKILKNLRKKKQKSCPEAFRAAFLLFFSIFLFFKNSKSLHMGTHQFCREVRNYAMAEARSLS